ncbi:hypothetical protein [Nocardiopsis tropica]|uniref:Uncharacterized protein n=1 Tax=Nocardiopsis tropica TaxID=109330 RepID=A0ABU7KM19_9ACTN|nr:hypothetical protein [Nocardiopsis umidischolae]MEE2050326.1 hypothetical protein [Nocardiopsis umidischolae]
MTTPGVCRVPDCDRLTTDHVCDTCAHRLAVALRDVPALLEDLDVEITKQARRARLEGGGRRTEVPLPFAVPASEARDVLVRTLAVWRRTLAGDPHTAPVPWFGPVCHPGCPHPSCRRLRASQPVPRVRDRVRDAGLTIRHRAARPAGPACWPSCHHTSCATIRPPRPPRVPGVAGLLLALLEDIRTTAAGGHLVDELCAAVDQARDHVHRGDTPGAQLAGLCPTCSRPVYARPAAATARCHDVDCRGLVDTAEWRQRARVEIARQVLPAADVVRALGALGHPISAHTLKSWVRRDRLRPCWATTDGRQRPLYLVADALDLTTRKAAS